MDEVTLGALKEVKALQPSWRNLSKVQMTTCDSPNIELAPCKVYLTRWVISTNQSGFSLGGIPSYVAILINNILLYVACTCIHYSCPLNVVRAY